MDWQAGETSPRAWSANLQVGAFGARLAAPSWSSALRLMGSLHSLRDSKRGSVQARPAIRRAHRLAPGSRPLTPGLRPFTPGEFRLSLSRIELIKLFRKLVTLAAHARDNRKRFSRRRAAEEDICACRRAASAGRAG